MAVVVDILAYAAGAIATHLCFRAVGVEDAHLEVGAFRGANQYDAVSSDTLVSVAEEY